MPPPNNDADAELAWERLRAAIERRFKFPGPAADAECARLRDELIVAMGETPHTADVIQLADRRQRRRAA